MAARRLPPRRVRNIRFAQLRPRRRRTEELLHSMVIGRAPGEILPFQLIVETGYFPLKGAARGVSHCILPREPNNRGRPRGFHLDCALAQRVKSLFRRAGDRKNHSSTALRPRRPRLRRGGAPIGRFAGLTGEKPIRMPSNTRPKNRPKHRHTTPSRKMS